MSAPDELTAARRRVAESLKVHGPSTAAQIAERLELTAVAVRQHLQGLEAAGLVRSEPLAASGRGRPSSAWHLTDDAMALFPDRHGELTVGLIQAIRGVVGEHGLDAIVDARGTAQKERYAALMPPRSRSLRVRVEALAAQRSREGYMAEVQVEKRGTYLLLEHHCPICEAASSCMSLCRVELDVFRHTLGPDVEVERVSHLFAGDERCVYRIRARA